MKVRWERICLTIIPSWTLSLDKLSTSGIIRDEELENAGVGQARGGGVPKAGSTGPKGAGTPSTGCVLSVLRIPPEPGNVAPAGVREVSATE